MSRLSIHDFVTHVGIGELKTGGRADVLTATLGSCVGIAFLWRGRDRYGLAHCLLPQEQKLDLRISARYVDRAIPSLLRMMGVRMEHYPEIEVVVAGGGRMFRNLHETRHVGKLNVDMARTCLQRYGLTVMRSETGGEHGRQIIVDCSGPNVTIVDIAAVAGASCLPV